MKVTSKLSRNWPSEEIGRVPGNSIGKDSEAKKVPAVFAGKTKRN